MLRQQLLAKTCEMFIFMIESGELKDFPSSNKPLSSRNVFMCRGTHTYNKGTLGVERDILVEFSSVNMTDSESRQDGSGFYVQPHVDPWFLRDSNINNCTASITVAWTSADGGSGMNCVNAHDNNPYCYWARSCWTECPPQNSDRGLEGLEVLITARHCVGLVR
jgi:hypothetical protein